METGYLHQYEYIEDKYPEAIRIEKEEDGSEVEVMDLLFFYDRKKLDEDAIRQRIIFLLLNLMMCHNKKKSDKKRENKRCYLKEKI